MMHQAGPTPDNYNWHMDTVYRPVAKISTEIVSSYSITMSKDSTSKKRKKEESAASHTGRKKKSEGTAGRIGSKSPALFYEEYCQLPFSLNTILIDECNYITRKGFESPHGYDCEPAPRPARSVHNLPAKVTVKQILEHYQRKRSGSNSSNTNISSDDKEAKDEAMAKNKRKIKKFCNGLALLFDDALPVCLLYAEERPQYESLQQDEDWKLKRPCEIYGGSFLLRLLVRLPILLAAEPQSEMDEMGPLIEDLIVLLQKNRQACFMKDVYREPKWHELLPWEKAIRNNNRSDNDSDKPNQSAATSPMAISRTP
jgi:hypothetical protein